MRQRILDLLEFVQTEEKKARKRAEESASAANETAKTSRTSWSAAGERDYSQGQAHILTNYHTKTLALKEKVNQAAKKQYSAKVEDCSYIKVVIAGKEQEFYLIDNPINISGIKFVSTNSLLGKAIMGKTVGEEFTMAVTKDNSTTGKIISVE